jgi:hypothetical protein
MMLMRRIRRSHVAFELLSVNGSHESLVAPHEGSMAHVVGVPQLFSSETRQFPGGNVPGVSGEDPGATPGHRPAVVVVPPLLLLLVLSLEHAVIVLVDMNPITSPAAVTAVRGSPTIFHVLMRKPPPNRKLGKRTLPRRVTRPGIPAFKSRAHRPRVIAAEDHGPSPPRNAQTL